MNCHIPGSSTCHPDPARPQCPGPPSPAWASALWPDPPPQPPPLLLPFCPPRPRCPRLLSFPPPHIQEFPTHLRLLHTPAVPVALHTSAHTVPNASNAPATPHLPRKPVFFLPVSAQTSFLSKCLWTALSGFSCQLPVVTSLSLAVLVCRIGVTPPPHSVVVRMK